MDFDCSYESLKSKHKEIAGSEECSPNAYSLKNADLVIKHYLYTKTWQWKPTLMKIIQER